MTSTDKKPSGKTALSASGVEFKRAEGFEVYPEDIVLVGRDPGTKVGDLYYDERVHRAPVEAMTKSIKVFRNVQEIALVRMEGDDGSERLVCAFGRGRVINGRQANIELKAEGQERIRLRARVFPRGTSSSDIEAMMAVENTQRVEETALELANKLAGFIARYGEEELPKMLMALDLDRHRADKLLRLREAPPETIREMREKRMGLEAALAFAQLPASQQASAVAEAKAKAGNKKVSAELARQVVRERKGQQVTQSKQQIRLLFDFADAFGWSECPVGIPLIGWQLGENSASDVPGLEKILKEADTWNKQGRPNKKQTKKGK